MGEARVRRFPPVSGPYGWSGAAFVFLALASQVVVGFLLFWLVLNRDGRVVIPMIVCFVLSFPLLGAALALWRIGMKRTGTLRPSTMPREQQRQVFGTLAVMNLATLLGLGAFIYVAFRLEGDRRLVLAMVPILLAGLASVLAMRRMQQVINRPQPRLLGLAPRQQTIILVALGLLGAALLVVTGLFWIPN
jgi:hypothetical protein